MPKLHTNQPFERLATRTHLTMTSVKNDDELEMNWAAEEVAVDSGDSGVEVADEDDDNDVAEEEKPQPSKRKAEENVVQLQAKKPKQQKSMKGLQNMKQEELFKLVNDVYMKFYGNDLTPIEIANGLTESHFTVIPQFGKHTLDSFTRFLRALCPEWKFLFKGKGIKDKCSPIILIMCSSALRAVEVGKLIRACRAIASFKCHVAKLFGKHLKLEEQVQNLKRFHPIAIGTPGRIKTLLEMKALSLECTTHVVIDMHRDSKNMSILELKDTSKDTIDCIRDAFLPQLTASKLSIALY
ncbi:ubiquitin-specific protease [Thraustotheca clavata]|uniref:Ubiquitin-specific protease n=1 Tax=Thraustotheca clavata TaxID=74557 RepID=A0A1V9YX53_9STRA|nr:ubiquitin-specific protease [Thraustotheca clavata]